MILGAILTLNNIQVGTRSFTFGYIVFGPICAVILIIALLYSKRFIQLDYKWAGKKVPEQETQESSEIETTQESGEKF